MKFGLRAPSLKRTIGGRTSQPLVVRHTLGVNALPGLGWLTNPKRGIYNRVYTKTTFSLWPILAKLFK